MSSILTQLSAVELENIILILYQIPIQRHLKLIEKNKLLAGS